MSDLLTGLNPEQRRAVEAIEGSVLVLAGPGSGKTRVLTHRIAHMIQGGITPWQILAVTFTNKAAREMRHRLDGLIGEQGKEVMMGTFHSICSRLLRRHIKHLGYENSFLIYDTRDQLQIITQSLKILNLDEERYKPNAVKSSISRAKNDGMTPKTFQPKDYHDEIIGRIYERYQTILIENNALDFDDLLLLTLRLFKEIPEVLERYQKRWKYLLVDEFQDTNLVQYQLIRLLGIKHQNVFVVGDIDQSIYRWRGADYRNVLKFEETFPKRKLITLEQNYRSTQHILNAASALIRHNGNRKEKGLWSQLGKGEPIEVFEAYDEREEASFIVRQIKRLKHRSGYRNRDFSIMYRMNAQSRALEEAFMRTDLKYTIVGATRFYERREVKDIIAYLRLIYNPADPISLTRIINVPKRGIGVAAHKELIEWAEAIRAKPFVALQRLDEHMGVLSPLPPHLYPPFTKRRRDSLLKFYHLLKPLIDKLNEITLPDLITELLSALNYSSYLRDGSEEGEQRWENIIELRNVAAQYEHLPVREALPEFLENASLVSDADSVPGEEADAVTLMTLHTAKGLEFPVVFLPGMENDILPHFRSQDNIEQMEEERRLAYVGITRAKQRLYLIYTFRRRTYGRYTVSTPSPFLRELPRETLKISKEQSMRPVGSQEERESSGNQWTNRSKRGLPPSNRRTTKPAPPKAQNRSSKNRNQRAAPKRSVPSRNPSSTAPKRIAPSRNSPSEAKNKRTGRKRTSVPTPQWETRRIDPKQTRKQEKPKTQEFKIGERVRHATFGEGIIISSKLRGNDEMLEVLFAGQKKRAKLLASFAKLQKL